MKKVNVIVLLAIFYAILGCSNNARTAPWTEQEVEQMESKDVKIIPIVIWSDCLIGERSPCRYPIYS